MDLFAGGIGAGAGPSPARPATPQKAEDEPRTPQLSEGAVDQADRGVCCWRRRRTLAGAHDSDGDGARDDDKNNNDDAGDGPSGGRWWWFWSKSSETGVTTLPRQRFG